MKKFWVTLLVLAGRLVRFIAKKLTFVLAVTASSLALTASLIYLWSQAKAEELLVEQVLYRKQVIARAGAHSIEGFLELTGHALAVFATRSAIVNWGENTQNVLDRLVTEWEGTPLVEVGLVDEEGNVRYLANTQKMRFEQGMSVVERDYFQALKGAGSGKVYIGQPILAKLGAYQGQYVVPVAATIYEQDEFKGIVGAIISLSQLTENYLQPLRLFPETQTFLIDESGTFLYSPYPESIGRDIIKWIKETSLPEKEKIIEIISEQMTNPKEAKFDLVWPDLENTSRLRRYLVASSLVDLGERKWILGVATPFDKMENFFLPFTVSSTTAFIVSIFIILSLSLLAILVIRITQKDAYLTGFKNGRKF